LLACLIAAFAALCSLIAMPLEVAPRLEDLMLLWG
jgi:hypothetical protein